MGSFWSHRIGGYSINTAAVRFPSSEPGFRRANLHEALKIQVQSAPA
jgi:hypothetical protein